MATITIHVIAKNSSRTETQTVNLDGLNTDSLNKIKDEFFDSISFGSWYYQVQCYEELTEEEEELLRECELDVDF